MLAFFFLYLARFSEAFLSLKQRRWLGRGLFAGLFIVDNLSRLRSPTAGAMPIRFLVGSCWVLA